MSRPFDTKARSALRVGMLYLLTIIWLILTVGTAAWWLYLGLRLSQSFAGHDYRHMFQVEGFVFISLIVAAGVGLLLAIRRVQRKTATLAEFLSTFSHEIKTAITNLRLQVEVLASNRNPELAQRSLGRLNQQCMRLQTQLENSLLLAQSSRASVFLEDIQLDDLLQSLQAQWPQVAFAHAKLGRVRGDARAIECVLSNLVQNSLVHGQASRLEFSWQVHGQQRHIEVRDNGKGYAGSVRSLGRLFFKFGSSGGNGIGLYLVRKLMRKMGGRAEFIAGGSGFSARLFFSEPA